MSDEPAAALVPAVQEALNADDIDRFSSLLDPNVTWSAPDADVPTCRNRREVLAWFSSHRHGRTVQLLEVRGRRDKILVAMTVSTPEGSEKRWQVLTVIGNKVSDIRGFDQEAAARAAFAMEP